MGLAAALSGCLDVSQPSEAVQIRTLNNRADLVSGGDAWVEVERGGDVIAEVDQLESTDDHGTRTGINKYK